jgi:outer membrane PBP1 activator LpoA protein
MTYEKAAALSESEHDRRRRLLAAADAAFTAGNPTKCADLLRVLAEEEGRPTLSPDEVRMEHLLGRLETWSGDPPKAAQRLLAQAQLTRDSDQALSLQLSVDATVAAMLAGQMRQASETARFVAGVGRELGPEMALLGDLLVGAVQAARGDGDVARDLLDPVQSVLGTADPSPDLLQHVIYLATAYNFIDRFDQARPLFTRAIAAARRLGALGLLPFALTQLAVTDFRTGPGMRPMPRRRKPCSWPTTPVTPPTGRTLSPSWR